MELESARASRVSSHSPSLLFHPAQMSLSWGSDSPVRGFLLSPLLHQKLGQNKGDGPLWLVKHHKAGKRGGTGSILPQLLLPPRLGSRAAPSLSVDIAMPRREGGGGAPCWHGQHC